MVVIWMYVWVDGWSDEGILDCFHNPSRQSDLDIDLSNTPIPENGTHLLIM